MKLLKALSITIVGAMIMSGVAYAATQSFTASITFWEPLSFNTAVNPDMGNWEAGITGRNFVLNTDDSVGGTDAAAYINGAAHGSVNVLGSALDTIDIVANNFAANGGVGINDVPCKYGTAAATTCGGAGLSTQAAPTTGGTALLLGVDVTTSTAHVDGDSANPTFDIVVTYN